LVPQIVLMNRDTQHHLCAILVDYKLVQVLSQRFGRDMALSNIACAAQGTSCGLVRLIEGREALSAEVGAVV
jgi:hypothetical protein